MFFTFSQTELEELANDEGGLLDIINQLPQLKTIVADRQELCVKNEQLARVFSFNDYF